MDRRDCIRPLACPVCGEGLALVERTVVCGRRHSFDVAREGYVNLLLDGGKRPKIQGDSKEMLQARRRFLEAGHYMPLARRVGELVAEKVGGLTAVPPIADIGCGEGWYMGQLLALLADTPACFLGVDVAKTAVQLAAKRCPAAQFIVADAWRKLPLVDGSISVLLNLFAPRNPAEFARVLAHNGLLLIVIPQPQHLHQLRHKLGLLDIEAEKQQKVVAQLADNFRLQAIEPLEIEMDLDRTALTNLAQMTPSYWHWTTAVQDKLSALNLERVTAVFEILTFTH
ncbi:MAG: methyltransferase domain-containing protein [Ardenticatenaceae bacterium]|nr:methyltransferase domain-containing protein [Ardenticatenaceae bacterium]